MSAQIFNGQAVAARREQILAERVKTLSIKPVVAAVVFAEDAGSLLYTRLKSEAAARVGIGYQVRHVKLAQPVAEIQQLIEHLNADSEVTGIIIQKPRRSEWAKAQNTAAVSSKDYQNWWRSLTSQLDQTKDVDGLHPATLAALTDGTWAAQKRVLPATVQAVLIAMEEAQALDSKNPVVILGKSDLLGTPLADELRRRGFTAELWGRKEIEFHFQQKLALGAFSIVVSATGQNNLVTGDMLQPNAVVIDVGEPLPDVERTSVEQVAAFLTPVPGGIGPLTVISLLENAVHLVS